MRAGGWQPPAPNAACLARAAGIFLLLVGLLAVPAFPQTDTSGGSDAPDSSSASGAPEPAADSEQPYNGPSVLGRDSISGFGLPQVNITPFAEISGVYDSGLNGIVIDPQGGIRAASAFGVQYTLGLSGGRAWRRSKLALSYSGSVIRYFGSTPYNNSNQSLTLGFTHQLTRHAMLKVNGAGSVYSRSFSQPTLSANYLPALDIWGNRTSMFNSQVAVLVQKTSRLSFSVAGSGGLTHQATGVVYDIAAAGFTGDAQYRLGPRASAGASYSFFHYTYPGSSSSTYFHSVGGNYALALSRRTEFGISAGFLRSESTYLQIIPVAPLFAYLTGARSAVIIHAQQINVPSGSARISRRFSRGSASLSGGYSVLPGNGLFLATVATTISGNYTYNGLRNWNLSAGGSYSKGKSIGTSLGHYGDFGANVSAARQVSRFTHVVVSFSAIQYRSSEVSYYNRLIYQARIGLGFSPNAIPLGPR